MKRTFNFVGHTKVYAGISLGIILIGILCNIFMPIQLDISFKGGTLLKYSFSGELTEADVDTFVSQQLNQKSVDTSVVHNDISGLNVISVSLAEDINLETRTALDDALMTKYPDNKISLLSASSLAPSMGRLFFIKCLVAIALASVFLVVYVALRFRKIGGISAGVMALVALFNDLLVAYFAFVIFRIPLNDNFVAVLLSILGYSLNDTIVIYDRIRENERLMDSKTPIRELVNTSLNQSFTRNCNTSLCVFAAITTVAVMALAMGLDSIISFAVPMMFGVLSGFYTSTFLCAPVWVYWKEHAAKRAAAKKAAAKSGKKVRAK